jgi:hypothetical protein
MACKQDPFECLRQAGVLCGMGFAVLATAGGSQWRGNMQLYRRVIHALQLLQAWLPSPWPDFSSAFTPVSMSMSHHTLRVSCLLPLSTGRSRELLRRLSRGLWRGWWSGKSELQSQRLSLCQCQLSLSGQCQCRSGCPTLCPIPLWSTETGQSWCLCLSIAL